MAKDVFRIVRNSFWTDKLILDNFSPEDKFFWFYILTNPRTTQLGIYEFSISDASKHLGYSKETVKILLDRFQNIYKVLKYSEISGEVAIKNYLRHSIVTGGKPVMDCLIKESKKVKDKSLFNFVFDNLKKYEDLNKTVQEFMDNFEIDPAKEKSNKTEDDTPLSVRLEHNFAILYGAYPKKAGKQNAFKRYKLWVTNGRYINGKKIKLTDIEIWNAIHKYMAEREKSGSDLQYYKNFDVLLGDCLLDYVEDKAV